MAQGMSQSQRVNMGLKTIINFLETTYDKKIRKRTYTNIRLNCRFLVCFFNGKEYITA